MTNESNGNGKLAALLKREATIRAAISAQRDADQRRAAKARVKLAEALGSALIDLAEISPAIKVTISSLLAGAKLEDRVQRLLQEGGWR